MKVQATLKNMENKGERMNNKNIRNDQDEDEDFSGSKGTLGYFVKQRVSSQYTIPIDESFTVPSYYRNVFNVLLDAGEDDTVIFMFNSPGGMLSGLLTLLEGIKMTEATTMAVLVGECSSAASILALHCDTVFVSESAAMLCHDITYGTGGKGSDILSHVQHVSKTSEKLLRKTYEHFLNPKEIDEMLNGKQIYLDSDEIKERLDNKAKLIEAQEQAEAEKPAKKPRKKATKDDTGKTTTDT